MDLLNLGAQSRKTGIRPRQNLRKDKYDMEDINDFFSDDESGGSTQSRWNVTPKDNFDNVARKINFTDAEAASFNLPPMPLSNSTSKKKNKKSPLRSPLPDKAKLRVPSDDFDARLDKLPKSVPLRHLSSSEDDASRKKTDYPKRSGGSIKEVKVTTAGINKADLKPDNITKPERFKPEITKADRIKLDSITNPKRSKPESIISARDTEDVEVDTLEDNQLEDNFEFDMGEYAHIDDDQTDGTDNQADEHNRLHSPLDNQIESIRPQLHSPLSNQPQSPENQSEQSASPYQEEYLNDEVFDDDYQPSNAPTQTQLTQESRLTPSQNSPQFSPERINASNLTKNMALGKTKPRKNRKKNPSADLSPQPAHKKTLKRRQAEKEAERAQIVKASPLPSPPPDGLRRSRRTRIAPLAFWRNERIVYTRAYENGQDPNSTLVQDIQKVPLQEIKEVVHYPEVSQASPPPKKRGRPKKAKSKADEYDYESDPEIQGSEWFETGNKVLEVNSSNDTKTEKVVAYTANGTELIAPKGRDGLDNFEVGLLFDDNKDFSAAGILAFPVEGVKMLRNSGDIVYNFHVVKGLIEVTLNEEKFVVTRGCSFQIPNRNTYGFKNLGNIPARLYFVQTRVPQDEDEF